MPCEGRLRPLGANSRSRLFSLENLGKPEPELKKKPYDDIRENMFLKKDHASGVVHWIWQIISSIVDLSIHLQYTQQLGFFDSVPSGFDPLRQDSVVLVVSPLSAVIRA